MIELYLHATNTQEAIAEAVGVTHQAIGKILESFTKNGQMSESCKTFTPNIYNI